MLTEKSIYLPNDLRNFNEIFRKDGAYDNIKSHKKTGLHLSLEDKFLEKPKGGGGIHSCVNRKRKITTTKNNDILALQVTKSNK